MSSTGRDNAAQDTIVALATPAGRGGVGVVRISGPATVQMASILTAKDLPPRQAVYTDFYTPGQDVIDQGIAIFFKAPQSYTGEDVLELQAHGGPYILDMIIETALLSGARLARPGEFTERAFLNDKIDLVQAEAIADMIEAGSREAARCASQSLQGKFSARIHQLTEALINLRIFVEAAIDFPEEEIDFLSDQRIADQLKSIRDQLDDIIDSATQGAIMRDGIHAVIVGRPNAGKSSLLNALSGEETAIVTHIEGTTRDVLRQSIQIDGIPVHVTDTAGIRDATDEVEKIGIERAVEEISRADLILLVVDAAAEQELDVQALWPEQAPRPEVPLIQIRNKIDLSGHQPGVEQTDQGYRVRLSAKLSTGIDELKQLIKKIVGYQEKLEGRFIARRRHLDALSRCKEHFDLAEQQLAGKAGELLAEELRICQNYLAEITGEFSSDDLLGRIFSSFCIGK